MFARLDTTPETELLARPDQLSWRRVAPDIAAAIRFAHGTSSLIRPHVETLLNAILNDRIALVRGGITQRTSKVTETAIRSFARASLNQWFELSYSISRVTEDGRFVCVPFDNLDVSFQYRDDVLWARVIDRTKQMMTSGERLEDGVVKDVLVYVIAPPTERGLPDSPFMRCLGPYASEEVLKRAMMRAWVNGSVSTTVVESAIITDEAAAQQRDNVVLGDFQDMTSQRATDKRMEALRRAREENEQLQAMVPRAIDLVRETRVGGAAGWGSWGRELAGGGLNSLHDAQSQMLGALVDRGILGADSSEAFVRVPSGFQAKHNIPVHPFPNAAALLLQISDEIRMIFGLPSQMAASAHKTSGDVELSRLHQDATIRNYQEHLCQLLSVMVNFAQAPEGFQRLLKKAGASLGGGDVTETTDGPGQGGSKEGEEGSEEGRRKGSKEGGKGNGGWARGAEGRGKGGAPGGLTFDDIVAEQWSVRFVRTLSQASLMQLFEMGVLGAGAKELIADSFGIPMSALLNPPKVQPPKAPIASGGGFGQ